MGALQLCVTEPAGSPIVKTPPLVSAFCAQVSHTAWRDWLGVCVDLQSLIDWSVERKLINWFQLLKCRDLLLFWSFSTVNEESLCLLPLVWLKKQFKDVWKNTTGILHYVTLLLPKKMPKCKHVGVSEWKRVVFYSRYRQNRGTHLFQIITNSVVSDTAAEWSSVKSDSVVIVNSWVRQVHRTTTLGSHTHPQSLSSARQICWC